MNPLSRALLRVVADDRQYSIWVVVPRNACRSIHKLPRAIVPKDTIKARTDMGQSLVGLRFFGQATWPEEADKTWITKPFEF